jgi:hypothetical protein
LRLGLLIAGLVALAGCGERAPDGPGSNSAGGALDQAAIEAGIMPDPDEVDLAGRFEMRSELGTDKFCAVASGGDFDIGFLSNSGPDSKCEGRGTATMAGDKVRITLSGEGSCSFEASYDGIEIRFPGALDKGCDSYCTPRASFSGTHYFVVQPGDAAARATLGRAIARLCP